LFNDEPGRGLCVQLVGERPFPLEFHTGVPALEGVGDPFRELAQRMAKAWQTLEQADPALKAKRAKPIEALPATVDLPSVLPPLMGSGTAARVVPLGLNDLDREPALIDFGNKGPHWLVVGPPVTGKTTVLRSLVLSLAHHYSPDDVALVLIDPSDASRRFFNYGTGGDDTLDKLPHVLGTATNAKELDGVVKRLMAEFDEAVIEKLKGQPGFTPPNPKRAIFVIIDHYDDSESLNKTGMGLNGLAEVGKGKNLHLVIGGTLGIMRDSTNELRKRAEAARYTLVLQDYEAVRYMGVRGNFSVNKELPPGRGFLIKAVTASLVQMALPVVDGKGGRTADDQLSEMIMTLRFAMSKRAQWSYSATDLSPLEGAIKGDEAPAEAPATSAAIAPPAEMAATMAELQQLMAAQAELTASLSANIPEAGNFASVEIPEDEDQAPPPAEDGKNGAAEPKGKKEKKKA
jgi:hypothetical protein